MIRFTTLAIVLKRTNYGEADRIFTFITAQHGKVRGSARGVRKLKSKLAAGLELFSVSEITFGVGRGEVNTVVSTKLQKHFGDIVKNLERTNAAYAFMKQLDKQTEDAAEEDYFKILANVLEALNDPNIPVDLIKLWFSAQLLRLAGRQPNLQTELNGQKLDSAKKYDFDYESMCFKAGQRFGANDIKLLRLVFGGTKLLSISRLGGIGTSTGRCLVLVERIEPKV